MVFVDTKELAAQAGKIGYPLMDRETAPSSYLVAASKSLEKLTKKLNATLEEFPAESEASQPEEKPGQKPPTAQQKPLDASLDTP